jgi:RNA polymerase sigma-70 factor, ECF subfamily
LTVQVPTAEPAVTFWKVARIGNTVIAVTGASSDLEARFLTLYEQEGPQILRYLHVRTTDRAEAEDLHAETFCRAWQAWPRFSGEPTDVRPWLFRIARNLLIDRHRRRGLVRFLSLEGHHASKGADDVAVGVTGRALLQEALKRASSLDRELIAFRVAGLSHGEIGKIQGRSEQAVKMAWHRTLERLRSQLEGTEHE